MLRTRRIPTPRHSNLSPSFYPNPNSNFNPNPNPNPNPVPNPHRSPLTAHLSPFTLTLTPKQAEDGSFDAATFVADLSGGRLKYLGSVLIFPGGPYI